LIDDRAPLDELAGRRLDEKVSCGSDREVACALETQVDDMGVDARREHEVVLQPVLTAVVDEIYARIDISIANRIVGRYVGNPPARVVADEVVASAGQLSAYIHPVGRVRPQEANGHHRASRYSIRHGVGRQITRDVLLVWHGARSPERQHCLCGSKKQHVATPARAKLHSRIGLTPISLKS
jgi:hypothetical protein